MCCGCDGDRPLRLAKFREIPVVVRPAGAVIIPRLQFLLSEARGRGWTVIYACDSFMPEDFIRRRDGIPEPGFSAGTGADLAVKVRCGRHE